MRVAMASVPAGPGVAANEDFLAAGPAAAVLLDGAGVSGIESICRHGVAWYACRLGGELIGALARDDGQHLPTLLGEAIDRVAGAHRDTCDLGDPSSPAATVAILRASGDRADYLVLGDSVLVLDRRDTGPIVVEDRREVTVGRRFRAAFEAASGADRERARGKYIDVLRANRNQPGGFWIAKDDSRAADEAITGHCRVTDLTDVTLLSNGASRIVDRFHAADWPRALEILREQGPMEIIRRVRAAERNEGVSPDDATLAHCTDLAGGG
ncbi:MAG TPA: hypothetical protein VGP16_21070 [Asanoa sp.]|jgi:hypothetical protein|nr:hypothetical protein [Asanoa sp.]